MWNAPHSKITGFILSIIPAVIFSWGCLCYQNSLHWKKVSHHWCLGVLKGEFCDLSFSSIYLRSTSIMTSNVVGSWSVKIRSTRREVLMCSSAHCTWWTQMECTMLFLVFWIQWVLTVLLSICNTDLLWKQHKVTTITSLDLIPKKRSSLHSGRI